MKIETACPCTATRRRFLLLALPTMNALADPAPLQCRMQRIGSHALRFELHNRSRQAWWLLRWGTPFEGGWFAPLVRIERDHQVLDYQGAQIKRGEPEATDYLRLAPGQRKATTLVFAPAWAVGAAGHYRIESLWSWHDAFRAGTIRPPRPRAEHQALAQPCEALEFRL